MYALILPEQLEVGGVLRDINSEFQVGITIMEIFERTDLTEREKVQVMVGILFVEDIEPEHMQEAAEKAVWFLNLGEMDSSSNQGVDYGRLYSWEQDGRFIIAAIDKVLGRSCRREQLHWWEFISAFYEIGECTFSTIVNQRKLKKKGKQSEADREWWNENLSIAQLKKVYTPEEEAAIKAFEQLLIGGEINGSRL